MTGTAAVITVPNGGVLDLGPTYGSYGMRYDQLKIAGSLNLSSAGNTLNFEFNPFFRPSVYGTDGAGTLILVDADSFTGTPGATSPACRPTSSASPPPPAADRWWACWAPRRSTC
ncbi:MAG: hypothetical protein U1F77_05130 [Kiritimatiellia bacterium]